MSLTSAQQAAVVARGNVLVVAGAGTGKTSALVERCLNCLLAEQRRTSLEEILMVTFTDAAAADMRRRIRRRLEQEVEASLKLQASSLREASILNDKTSSKPAGAESLQLSLDLEFAFSTGGQANQPDAKIVEHLREQLALFETAHIGTLHGFCLQLVRQHFYELGLDPQMTVLAEEEARLLANETLEDILQQHYAGRTEAAKAVQELIQIQGDGRDQPIRALVLRLHHYTQTRPDPATWLQGQLANFAAPRPEAWERWLAEALVEWRARWLPILERLEPQNGIVRECAAALGKVRPNSLLSPALSSKGGEGEDIAAALQAICAAGENFPRGNKAAWMKPLKGFLEEVEFFSSLANPTPLPTRASRGEGDQPAEAEPGDPLVEDWGWVRSQMITLLELAREFQAKYADAKRELGVVDFHDLEQHALRLLWETKANQPTSIARHWRKQFRFVFVDEYQDINAAQDKIIEALSRDHPHANRFLVGDVKQSIYRFRLADPSIFQKYAEVWRGKDPPDQANALQPRIPATERTPHPGPLPFGRGEGESSSVGLQGERHGHAGQVIPLVENFRSQEGLLNFVNSFFAAVMRRELGGVDYDEQARLRFGAPEQRQALSAAANPGPRVELCVRLKGGGNAPGGDAEIAEELAGLGDLEEADKEARSVALRLRELKTRQHPVWDEDEKKFRPVEWSDIAILLRSPANKSERYAKEFARLNVPLQVSRGGFYESLEISDLLSLLEVLDNPLQDLPLLAVLHSPLVGLNLDELATIRLTLKGPFWTALARWEQSPESRVQSPKSEGESPESKVQSPESESETQDARLRTQDLGLRSALAAKVATFLDRYTRWRRLARQASLSRCLEAVLVETHYASWLQSQPGGVQRHANVQRLLALARQFDQFQRQGLFRFLRFVEAQREADSEPDAAPVTEENSVRLMSIHQSKGLEFPLVVVADLGKAFNVSDLRADVILDEKYGLCPQIKAPHAGGRYPSLPYWLASRRQHREMLGEELRLLYVAMTRARDTLLLSASVSESRFNKVWRPSEDTGDPALFVVNSYADWLGQWFSRNCVAQTAGIEEGENALVRWAVHDDANLIGPAVDPPPKAAEPPSSIEPGAWQELRQRLEWQYPFAAATNQAAKIRVSEFSRRAAQEGDEAVWVLGKQKAESRKQKSEDVPPASPQVSHIPHHVSRITAPASAAAIGTIHHTFLELVSLEHVGSVGELRAEALRLEQLGSLTADEAAELDFDGIAAFWTSGIGREVRKHATCVRRELAFTVRFTPGELAMLTGGHLDPALATEVIVAEGKADLAIILPEEIRLVDFKTDRVASSELPERAELYAPQLKLYAEALSQIYRRPVTECWLYFLAAREAVRVGEGNVKRDA